MKRIFVHPDMKIGAGAAQNITTKMSNTLVKTGVIDSDSFKIGDRLARGDVGGAAEDLITTTTGDGTVGAVVGVMADVVAAVLAGENVGKKEITAAENNEDAVVDTTTLGNDNSNIAHKKTQDIKTQTENDVTEAKVMVDGEMVNVETTVRTSQDLIDNVKATNEERQKQIDENNKIIKDTEEQRNNLLIQIENKKKSLNIPTKTDSVGANPNAQKGGSKPPIKNSNSAPQQGGNSVSQQDGTSTTQQSQYMSMSTDGIDDPELMNLISQYNSLGAGITELSTQNLILQEQMTTDNEVVTENIDQTITTTDEQLANIDTCANQIMSTIDSAEGAIKEISSMLKGEFKTIDQKTCIKLAGEMVKAGINGTQSGLLATAATAMGVGSIFSFGSTASEVAKLTKNSGECATASAKEIAANVSGKLLQNFMRNSMNQVLGNLSDSILNLTSLDQDIKSQISSDLQNLNSNVMMPYLTNNNIKNPDNNGGNENGNDPTKTEPAMA